MFSRKDTPGTTEHKGSQTGTDLVRPCGRQLLTRLPRAPSPGPRGFAGSLLPERRLDLLLTNGIWQKCQVGSSEMRV